MQRRGLFITLEGTEGVGKSTQREYLTQWFEAQGRQVTLTREPGGTPAAEKLRDFLLSHHTETIPAKSELLLFFAARLLHVENVIKPHMARGNVVLCDRFVDSTYAYQAGGRGLPSDLIEELHHWTLEGFKPDITIVLHMDVDEAMARCMRRGALDRFEVEQKAFFINVNQTFLDIAAREPERCVLVDASGTEGEVARRIREAVAERIAVLEANHA